MQLSLTLYQVHFVIHAHVHHTHTHTHMQDFDPEDFSQTISSDGLDRTQMQQLMGSSHMPYILNRLNVSVSANGSAGVRTRKREWQSG